MVGDSRGVGIGLRGHMVHVAGGTRGFGLVSNGK